MRDEFGLESDAIWSDDGIIVHLPDADEAPAAELVLVQPDELEELVVRELSSSALFGARFRENAARALLLPRARPGKRTPLWQQRLKAQSLLEVAKRYGQFPIVLETYRECLRDVFDLPGLEALLRGLHTRELSLVEVETQRASPFASSLLFDYVATYMYEGDTPNAERRAAALSLDRDLLRELLGQEELRELIDPAALAEVEADLQRVSERTRAANADGLHDVLRALGDLTADEAQARCLPAVSAQRMLAELEKQRRAVRMRIAGEERWLASEDAGLYRDALGAVPPGGLPEVFLEPVEEPLVRLTRRFARTHGPFATAEPSGRYGVDLAPVLRDLERAGDLVQGELRPGGSGREWCDPEVLRRLRRASLATLRKEIEPAEQRALARFLPAWQGVDTAPPGGAGVDRLRELLVPLQGVALAPEVWERDVLPRRVGAYSPAWMDQLCASGELVWVGAGALGRRSGRVALLLPRRRALARARRRSRAMRPPARSTTRCGRASRAGAAFWTDLLVDLADVEPVELQEALWDLVWAGEVTNDAFAPLRAPRLTLARQQRDSGRHRAQAAGSAAAQRWASPAAAGRARPRSRAAGRSPRRCSPAPRPTARGCARSPRSCSSATGSSRARPSSPRASRAASPRSTASCPTSRPWAPRAGATSSRGSAARSSPCPRRSSACAALRADEGAGTQVLAATDPANPFGATLAWPKREDDPGAGPRGCRAPTSSPSTPSRRSTSSAAARAWCRSRAPGDAWLAARAGGARRGGQARTRAAARDRALRRRAGRRVGGRASCWWSSASARARGG